MTPRTIENDNMMVEDYKDSIEEQQFNLKHNSSSETPIEARTIPVMTE